MHICSPCHDHAYTHTDRETHSLWQTQWTLTPSFFLRRTPTDSCCNMCQQKWQWDIITAAQPWLEHAIDSWDKITVKHKDEHLDQALLYKDASMEVLLHCFDKHGANSYIHNHKASFLSLCLSGQYVERKWSLDHNSAGSYIECRRYASLRFQRHTLSQLNPQHAFGHTHSLTQCCCASH